jgi:hypothetical protein
VVSRLRHAWSIATLVAMAMSACASVRNTPEQDLAYARWAACAGSSTLLQMDRVEPSGRIWFSYFLETERQTVVTCLLKAEQGGPNLPPPVAVYRAKGGA